MQSLPRLAPHGTHWIESFGLWCLKLTYRHLTTTKFKQKDLHRNKYIFRGGEQFSRGHFISFPSPYSLLVPWVRALFPPWRAATPAETASFAGCLLRFSSTLGGSPCVLCHSAWRKRGNAVSTTNCESPSRGGGRGGGKSRNKGREEFAARSRPYRGC